MRRIAALIASLALLAPALATPATAQPGHDAEASPYAELLGRQIKALSEEEVRGLLEGEGMGLALAAELNGYPGPKHLLELAEGLELTAGQRSAVDAIRRRMQEEARRLGALLVRAEQELDEAFASGGIGRAALRERVLEAARLRGELRAAHLEAHLFATEVLEPVQLERYRELRGYGGSASIPDGGEGRRGGGPEGTPESRHGPRDAPEQGHHGGHPDHGG